MDRGTSMVLALFIISVVIALFGSRKGWNPKQCPFCRSYIPARATKCRHCDEWYPTMPSMKVLLAALLLAGTVEAQSLVCGRPTFFAEEECVATAPPAPQAPAAMPEPPLFTKQSVSPHTPPELLTLANDPTPANALRYVRRQVARNKAEAKVQALVQEAWMQVGVPNIP